MFPVSDFNVVVCGMATFAATVGYVCSKRLVRRNSDVNAFDSNPTTTIAHHDATMLVEQTATPPSALSVSKSTSVVETEKRQLPEDIPDMSSKDITTTHTVHVQAKSEPAGVLIPTTETTQVQESQTSLPEPVLPVSMPQVASQNIVSAEPSPTPDRRRSLKRKQMHNHDENNNDLEYPYNLTAIYPNKRRTPPRDEETSGNGEQNTISFSQSSESQASTAPQPNDVTNGTQQLESDRDTRNTLNATDTAAVSDPNLQKSSDGQVEICSAQSTVVKPQLPLPKSSPKSILASKDSSVKSSITTTTTPDSKSTPRSNSNPFTAFSSYTSPSNSPSPFSPFSSFSSFPQNKMCPSPNSNSIITRPVWSSGGFRQRHGFSDSQESGSPNNNENERVDEPHNEESTEAKTQAHAIGSRNLKGEGSSSSPSYTHLTGEEEETVECELKGVKLFIKRGAREYSSGMLGHVKLLSSKNRDVERLLFRREPLWKVSMNARLQSSVRCSFDSEESILRVILPEFSESSIGNDSTSTSEPSELSSPRSPGNTTGTETGAPEIVVYAMKPGRFCSKQEFGDFASSVMKKSGMKG